METFKSFLFERKDDSRSWTVEMYMHNALPPSVILHRKDKSIKEKLWKPDEPDHLDGHAYKVLGEFKPSKLDHDTISKEIHEHLAKHGYYSHSPVHPLVMSPEEQTFKSEFKRRFFGKKPSHEAPHHDGGRGGPRTGYMGRHTAVWSTHGPTHIFHPGTKERIPHATLPGHTTVFNDEKVMHAASGERNRWFLRLGEIRKIPSTGLQSPTRSGKVKQFGNDVQSYIHSKAKNVGGPKRDVYDALLRYKRQGKLNHPRVKETMDWVKRNHPQFHPSTK